MYKLKLLSKKTIFNRFIKVEELDFELPQQQVHIKRFVVSRPEAAAIILHNTHNHSVILIKQFRAPVYNRNDNPFIFEAPAGVLESNENAADTIIRESLEETGYQIDKPILLSTIYPSPGILDEKIHLFYAEVNSNDKVSSGGGLDTEHEFLDVVDIHIDRAFEMIKSGEINDAKTITALFLAKDYFDRKG